MSKQNIGSSEDAMRRQLLVWLILMSAEVVHGTHRELYIKPMLGDFRAHQVFVFTGSLILFTFTRLFLRWMRISGREIKVGLAWLVLTVVFEVSAARWLAGRSWPEIGSDFSLWQGRLFPVGLTILTLSPLLAARIRR